jgi:aspartate/glutamate racemase
MLVREKGSQGSMKTIGMIGGIGPESTIEYYRSIIAWYIERIPDGSYPSIIINSIDLKRLLNMVEANERAKMTEFLVSEIQRLARAGAECGLVASNTPHIKKAWPVRHAVHHARSILSRRFLEGGNRSFRS